MSIAISLHLLAAAIWVGGMFFAYMAMRPAVAKVIEGPQRGLLWCHTLSYFFRWVWLAVALILASGYWMIFAAFGGMAAVGLHVHLMHGLGWLMVLIYAHVFFAPYARLKRAVVAKDPQAGAAAVAQIRRMVGSNLIIGLLVIAIGAGGRYF